MTRAFLVAGGGALGALARWAVSGWVARATQATVFPWGTLAVNLSGAFALGMLMSAGATGPFLLTPRARTFLAVGFLGAFTTFSTFTYETLEALRAGDLRVAGANVLVSVVAGLVACWLGMQAGARL